MRTEAQKKADAKSNKKIYEPIKFSSRRENRLREQIALAANRNGISSAQYIINAIQVQLDLDGISIEDLPEQE